MLDSPQGSPSLVAMRAGTMKCLKRAPLWKSRRGFRANRPISQSRIIGTNSHLSVFSQGISLYATAEITSGLPVTRPEFDFSLDERARDDALAGSDASVPRFYCGTIFMVRNLPIEAIP